MMSHHAYQPQPQCTPSSCITYSVVSISSTTDYTEYYLPQNRQIPINNAATVLGQLNLDVSCELEVESCEFKESSGVLFIASAEECEGEETVSFSFQFKRKIQS
eukprot:407467_1